MVQLRSSEIGDDLAYYLTDSEQVPSAVGLGATLDDTGRIAACGGFLVQSLPNVDDDEIEQIMKNIEALPPLSAVLKDGGPELLVQRIFDSVAYTLLETRDIFFRCGCSREKVEQALLTFGPEELHDMGVKEMGARASCEFCRKVYLFDLADLERLAQK
jgi:molecular chaperone Hsp33